MKPILTGKELLTDISKTIGVGFLFLWLCGMALFFMLGSISHFLDAKTPTTPNFTFDNVGTCLEPNQKLVERFVLEDQQYVCAIMATDEPNVYLELHVYTSDKQKQVYVTGKTFTSGQISFYIYPPLPPGKYWAKITWAKPALTDFFFDVTEK